MIARILSIMSLVTGIFFLVRYRYRIVNVILSRQWLRTLAIKLTMQLPFVRKKILNQMFRSSASNV